MAEMVGISISSVQRIWRARPQAPSTARVQAVQRPAFDTKLKDVVGLYVDPPDHPVVLSINEKSQIQVSIALNRACR
jgi:hypothetical protein